MDRNPDDILDELLVMKAQQGDSAALQSLVRRWHPRLIRHAHKLTDRHDVAADVVQEGWLAIVRGLSRLSDPATFRSWAYRIVHHKAIDWIRSQVRQKKANRDVGEQLTATVSSQSVSQLDEMETLRNAIAKLSPEQQILLRMFYDDHMSVKEIAVVLDVPVGTLKSRLFDLRKQLKETIERQTK
jgi:RNA polymerase sigma-70 factor, ECF subfamily